MQTWVVWALVAVAVIVIVSLVRSRMARDSGALPPWDPRAGSSPAMRTPLPSSDPRGERAASDYRRLVKLARDGQWGPGAHEVLENLTMLGYGPAFALQGALRIRLHPDDPVGRRLAAGYWLTGAAEHDDGASKILYDESVLDSEGKLNGFDIAYVVDMYLRCESSPRAADPDARNFMVGAALSLGFEEYARPLARRA